MKRLALLLLLAGSAFAQERFLPPWFVANPFLSLPQFVATTFNKGVSGGGPGTSPSLVTGQFCSASTTSTSVSTLTCNLPNNIASGHGVLIAATVCCSTATVPAAADGPADTLTQPTGCSVNWDTIASPALFSHIWYAQSSAGGSKSVTVNFTGTQATFSGFIGWEIQNPGAVDGSCVTNALDTSASFPSLTLTTSTTNEYLFVWGNVDSSSMGVPTAVSGFSFQVSGGVNNSYFSSANEGYLVEDKSAATATGYAGTWSDGAGSTRRSAIGIIIK